MAEFDFNFRNWQKFTDFIQENLPIEQEKSFNLYDLSEQLNISTNNLIFLFTIFMYACEFCHEYRDKIDIKILNNTINFYYSKKHINEISLDIKDYKDISDIIYLFKNIQRGKGFEVKSNPNFPIIKKIKELNNRYPFLFKRLNGFVFPSEIGYKLGNVALSFKRTNQIPKKLDIFNYRFDIKKKGDL